MDLGERLRNTVLIQRRLGSRFSPRGADDLRGPGALLGPVSVDGLSSMRRFEVLLRMPGPEGARVCTAGRSVRRVRLTLPPRRRSWRGATRATPARSDDVADEVARRSGPIPKNEARAQGEVEDAAKGART